MEINGEFGMSKRFYFNLLFTALAAIPATALASRDVGNGGDICENRFQSVRDDIKSWINNGGSAGLALPSSLSLQQYNSQLVHHEYAGLAGVEVNESDESKYSISNQISGGKDGGRYYEKGYPNVQFSFNVQRAPDARVGINLNLSPKSKPWKGYHSYGGGLVGGHSFFEVMVQSEWSQLIVPPSYPCKVSAIRFVCAATQEIANKSIDAFLEGFEPNWEKLPKSYGL
jgi:hypothetical protein